MKSTIGFFTDQKNSLFTESFNYVRKYFEEQEKEELQITNQDEAIFNLCRIDRLLELIYKFIIFDGGGKKIACYPQYFDVKKLLRKLKHSIKTEGGLVVLIGNHKVAENP